MAIYNEYSDASTKTIEILKMLLTFDCSKAIALIICGVLIVRKVFLVIFTFFSFLMCTGLYRNISQSKLVVARGNNWDISVFQVIWF